jgi:hypothetical protein
MKVGDIVTAVTRDTNETYCGTLIEIDRGIGLVKINETEKLWFLHEELSVVTKSNLIAIDFVNREKLNVNSLSSIRAIYKHSKRAQNLVDIVNRQYK